MMKRSRYICAATSSGSVNLLDPATFKVIKTWRAHAAGINDMDAQNNFLVTCGYSPRQQQGYMLDPLANAFDLKTLAPLPPIPFHAGAAYVRMHPRMSTTGIVASQSGQLQVVDLMNPNTVNLRQAVVSSYLTGLELAPSGEALALADADCFVQSWLLHLIQVRVVGRACMWWEWNNCFFFLILTLIVALQSCRSSSSE